jgi:hypothetical protein
MPEILENPRQEPKFRPQWLAAKAGLKKTGA